MVRTKFIGMVLVVILGVNLGAWTLSVATGSSSSVASINVPVTPSAIDARSQAANVELSQSPIMTSSQPIDMVEATNTASTTATATSSIQ